MAVSAIHDSVTCLLNEHTELPHFHVNEALFKPFENLICLELCDTDVQDQVRLCAISPKERGYPSFLRKNRGVSINNPVSAAVTLRAGGIVKSPSLKNFFFIIEGFNKGNCIVTSKVLTSRNSREKG